MTSRHLLTAALVILAPLATLEGQVPANKDSSGVRLRLLDSTQATDEPVTILSLGKAVRPSGAKVSCGVAQLRFIIGPDGRAETASIEVVATNDPAVAQAAISELQTERFTMPRFNGQPVRLRRMQQFSFDLTGDCRAQQAALQRSMDSLRELRRAQILAGGLYPGVSADSTHWPFFAPRTGRYYFGNTPNCTARLGSDRLYFTSAKAAEDAGFLRGGCR
jgi:hypothetical protein